MMPLTQKQATTVDKDLICYPDYVGALRQAARQRTRRERERESETARKLERVRERERERQIANKKQTERNMQQSNAEVEYALWGRILILYMYKKV